MDNLSVPMSSNTLPNKSDSGVEGATSSLETSLLVTTTPEDDNNFANNNMNTMVKEIYEQANVLSDSSTKHIHNENTQPRGGKFYNNNRGNNNRRGSFNRRWRGPGYSSDHQPSPRHNNYYQQQGNPRYKQGMKVILQTCYSEFQVKLLIRILSTYFSIQQIQFF